MNIIRCIWNEYDKMHMEWIWLDVYGMNIIRCMWVYILLVV